MTAYLAASVAASCIAVLTAVLAVLVAVYKRGLNEGKLTEILASMRLMVADHEARIRALEHDRK